MTIMINYIFLIFFLNSIFFIFLDKIAVYYNLYDLPDFKRKIHSKPIPLLGGLLIILNLFLILIINFFYENILDKDFFIISFSYYYMYLALLAFFLVGFIDDKFQISPNKKLLFMIIFIILLIYFDETVLVKTINFSFINYKLSLGIYSYPLTILCFMLFINAFNMIDGINGQAISYAIFIFFVFLLNNILINFSILLIISFLFYLILNLTNKTYLGDSGSLLIGFLIAYIFVKTNNISDGNIFYSDEIFLIMLIPGIELVRVAFTRIIKKQHAFSADSSHIHHILIKNLSFVRSYFIIQILLIFPYIFYLITKTFFISLCVSVALYTLLIIFFKKNT